MVRAVVLVMLVGCWRGGEPASVPAPTPAVASPTQARRLDDPPRRLVAALDVSQINPRGVSFGAGSPGPLIAGHAAWDAASACSVCHSDTQPDVPRAKCLACHAPIASRINASRGFHATAQVSSKTCESCHNDHKGRGFDPMGWRAVRGGRLGFDHASSGWPVPAPYEAMRCTQCHVTVDRQGLQLFLDGDRAQFP
jgi:hypothetical protein